MLFAFSNTFCSVAKSYLTLCNPHGMQHTRLPCSSLLSPGVCANSCPLSWWCYLISFSAAPFSSCLLSFPASGSFPMTWLLASSGQSIGVSASASVLSMNIQSWFSLGLTGLITNAFWNQFILKINCVGIMMHFLICFYGLICEEWQLKKILNLPIHEHDLALNLYQISYNLLWIFSIEVLHVFHFI